MGTPRSVISNDKLNVCVSVVCTPKGSVVLISQSSVVLNTPCGNGVDGAGSLAGIEQLGTTAITIATTRIVVFMFFSFGFEVRRGLYHGGRDFVRRAWIWYGDTTMKFIALDVETANPSYASICQIGIAHFVDGRFSEKWESLVDPEDDFYPLNIGIHGINESMVADAPTFPSLSEIVTKKLVNTVVVSHTPFDQTAIRLVFEKYGIELPVITWLDTARVVRRTWTDLSRRGYGLAPVAERLGIEFQHHNAAEDARAAGEILLHAMKETGLSVDEWVVRARKSIGGARDAREANPDGPLYGEVAVFTGTLVMVRREAADLAAAAGCDVRKSVTKSTTLLIVGDQDVRKLAGHQKSSKHRKAEKLIEKGQSIRILRESDFRSMASFVDRQD